MAARTLSNDQLRLKCPDNMMNVDGLPALDDVVINELREIMEDDFSLLLETFLSDAVERMGAISDAVAAMEADQLREAAHSFKGSCLNIGAQRLSALAANLEQDARDRKLDSVANQWVEIQSHYGDLKQLIEQQLVG